MRRTAEAVGVTLPMAIAPEPLFVPAVIARGADAGVIAAVINALRTTR
jgi:hypothetical protein